MASNVTEILEKVTQLYGEEKAMAGDAEAQYDLGMKLYNAKEFRSAEYWLEQAAKNEATPLYRKRELREILSKKEFGDLYNSFIVPYAASRITSGGNSPSGSWSKWNDK